MPAQSGFLGMSLVASSESTGKDLAFLISAGTTLLCLMVSQLRAGRSVYAEDPGSGPIAYRASVVRGIGPRIQQRTTTSIDKMPLVRIHTGLA